MGTGDGTVPKVVILGGGPCGLYAARVLAAGGVKVMVLEMRRVLNSL